MKVELFRNREGKVVAAAVVGPEGAIRSRFEPLEEQTIDAPNAAVAARAPEIVEADLSDPDDFFRKYQG
jgi:hypothetical protein